MRGVSAKGRAAIADQISRTLDRLSRSRESLQDSRALVASSDYRLATSHRLLNPTGPGSVPSRDDPLRIAVRERLASGALFVPRVAMWAGFGSGLPCAVCDEAVGPLDGEYVLRSWNAAAQVVAHFRCYVAWRAELDALHGLGAPGEPPAAPHPAPERGE